MNGSRRSSHSASRAGVSAPIASFLGIGARFADGGFSPRRDAFRFLEHEVPEECSVDGIAGGGFCVRVRVASESSKPRALTFAIARAVGFEVGSME